MDKVAVLAGSSGFIGQSLIEPLTDRGYTVRTIGRRDADADWADRTAVNRLVDGADLLINLAGRSVGCRYTDRNRNQIWSSPIRTTGKLLEAVTRADHPPRLWLNASTATIYRHATDRPQTEADGELGEGFSVDVARGWEREFFTGSLPRTRRVALRMAIVLGDSPALQMLTTAARFGVGGPQLEGRWFAHRRYRGIGPEPSGPLLWKGHPPTHGQQRFSWIHIRDVVRAIGFIDDHEDLTGPVNLAAPVASTNAELMACLRRSVGARFGVPTPRWLLEPGMFVLRQESELVLKSRWVRPERLNAAGFGFEFDRLPAAVSDLLGSRT